jgi:hypothetical protein
VVLAIKAVTGLGFLSAIGREHREILAELASRHAQSQIIDVACAVELEAYETPAFHDRLVRAAGGGQFRPWQVVEGLTGLAGAAVGIAGIALALLALQPWLVPLVLAAAVPLLIAVARGGELMFGFRHRCSGTWPPRWCWPGIVAALLVLALNGRIGLADAGTAAGAVFILGERLMNAVFSSGMLYESSLFIEDYTSFVAMAPEVEARPRPASGASRWRTSASPTRAPPPRP